jgi:nucleotide-binding universal stress UspA family protein
MAFPFKRILCPIDFDRNSLQALDVAAQIARQNDGTVFLVHVVPFVMPPPFAPSNVYSGDAQQDAARERLREIAQTRLKDAKYVLSTHVGDIAATILRAEREFAADVIVMATHGRQGFSRVILGGVAEKVVRESICPVLALRGSAFG